MIPEAAKLIEGLPEPLRDSFAACYSFLVDDSGCAGAGGTTPHTHTHQVDQAGRP
jgi:hypothetical protein